MFLKKLSSMQLNAIYIIISVVIVKLPIVLRDIILVGCFGVNKDLDIYLYALIAPAFFAGIIVTSFNYFLIPNYWRAKTDGGEEHAREYTNTLLTYTIFLTLGVSVLAGLAVPQLLTKINPIFFNSPEQINYFYALSLWAGAYIFFSILSAFFFTLLQAEHKYYASLFPQALVPISSIAAIIFYQKTHGVAAAIYGTTLGAFASCLLLYFYSLKSRIITAAHWKFRPAKINVNYDQFFTLIFAFAFSCLTTMIDPQMASALGKGKLTVFTYGIRVPDGLTEILCAGLGIAVFSHFSQWHANKKHDLLIEASQKAIISLTILIIPVCAFMIIYAQPIISVLFEHGAFSKEATEAVAEVLGFYAFSVYLAVLATIGAKIVSAIGKNNFFLRLAIILFIVKILGNIILSKLMGISGIALATVLTQLANGYLIFHYLHKQNIQIFQNKFLHKLFTCIMLLAIIITAISFTRWLTAQQSFIVSLAGGMTALIAMGGLVILSNRKHQLFTFTLSGLKNE